MTIFPESPNNVDIRILEPTREFKIEAAKVFGVIILFIVLYLGLIAGAIGLTALCTFLGIGLVVLKPMSITIMLGIGLVGLGVLVIFFLLKFLFKRHKVSREGLIEVTRLDQPRLFEFIESLSKETQTRFPKKIYLSTDVNASVFYDSSFWSMFFPVKKNLQIGLGLINSINISELKAILAHEFGHFSQRSMKLGSYVYNLNHIIFNLLHDNEDYEYTLERFGNASGYFLPFAKITALIIRGIQWILLRLYTIVNKQYMVLSRQMEFHADTVSASVTGANHLIAALRRLDFAESTFGSVFQFYETHAKEALVPDNIFKQHTEVMKVISKTNELTIEGGLPQITQTTVARFNASRLVVKDQWASHPSIDDREAHLKSLCIETPAKNLSAWEVFDNAEDLQVNVTRKAFENINREKESSVLSSAEFAERYRAQIERYQLHPAYKGFFNNRDIAVKSVDAIVQAGTNESFDAILTEAVLALPHRIEGLQSDIYSLRLIANGQWQIKNFEFNGVKRQAYEADSLRIGLEDEMAEAKRLLSIADSKIISWFLQKADAHGMKDVLINKYRDLFQITETFEKHLAVYNTMQECLAPLYQTMQFDDIRTAIARLKNEEAGFRDTLTRLSTDPSINALCSEEDRKTLTEYLSREWEYFRQPDYLQSQIDRLVICVNLLYTISSQKVFDAKSDILNNQLLYAGAPVANQALSYQDVSGSP